MTRILKRTLFILLTIAILFSLAGCSLQLPELFSKPTPTPVPTPEPTPEPTPTPTPKPYADGFDICGRHYPIDAVEIDLSGISSDADISLFAAVAPWAEKLTTVHLGSESTTPVSWNVISRLQAAAPNVRFDYAFSLYGESMTLDTEYIDLRKIPVNDNAEAVVAALPCMKKCTYLDMDDCGVPSERMAQIRDMFPNVKVVWRVWFSTLDYSVRTDVKTVLASLTGEGPYCGITNEESAIPLTYCTDVINLDLGHNNNMRTLSFIRYMPNLEVFITYNNFLRDVDDLAYAKHLKYLELYGSSMYDIKALADLNELTDLLICFCYNLEDISPIIPADKVTSLRRLWLTPDIIPQEQIDAFQANHPNCIVNTTDNSTDWFWRSDTPMEGGGYTPQYQETLDIFHYRADNLEGFSFSKNDPYYTAGHGQPIDMVRAAWFYSDVHYSPYS